MNRTSRKQKAEAVRQVFKIFPDALRAVGRAVVMRLRVTDPPIRPASGAVWTPAGAWRGQSVTDHLIESSAHLKAYVSGEVDLPHLALAAAAMLRALQLEQEGKALPEKKETVQ